MSVCTKASPLRALWALGTLSAATILAASAQRAPATPKAQLVENYGKIPLSFEANSGQTDKRVKFTARGHGYSLYLTGNAAVLALSRSNCDSEPMRKRFANAESGLRAAQCAPDAAVVRMQLAGSTIAAHAPAGEERLPGTANYFVGNDPAQWRAAVPTYSRIRYSGVYPGVDLLYYGNQRQLEYDFVVAPAADPAQIRMRFAGAKRLRLDPQGNLVISTRQGAVTLHKPFTYQQGIGQRTPVAASFALHAGNSVSFSLGRYDHTQALVIDPVLVYSTYLGGDSQYGDIANAIAVDAEGNAYIAGRAGSTNFPVTTDAFQQTNAGAATSTFNAFVTKLNSSGTALVYSTYLGGSGQTNAQAIAVDSAGNAYVTGLTFATNFPATAGAYQLTSKVAPGQATAFVTKLNAAGTELDYSTYLGGSGSSVGGENGNAIAVDNTGNAYVAGITYSSNFPVTTGAYQTTNLSTGDNTYTGFVTKLNATGTALAYSTYLGGSGTNGEGDSPYGIALDSAGDAYITGEAASSNFPTTTGAYQATNPASSNGETAAYVTKLNPAGSAPVYSTFVGGSENSAGYAIAVDSADCAYVTGTAHYTDFPVTPGAYQSTNNASAISASNAFVFKLNSAGTALDYSTWLGGSGVEKGIFNKEGDSASSIAVDSAGDAYVAGTAISTNFPVTSAAFQATNYGATNKTTNAFVTELNPSGTELLYSTYIGGTGVEVGSSGNYVGDDAAGIAIDSSDNIYVAGAASSTDFPVSQTAYQLTNASAPTLGSNAFLAKFGAVAPPSTTTTLTSSANPAAARASVTFTADVQLEFGTGATPSGSVQFSVDGTVEATVTLNASAVATYTTSMLASGSHAIVAIYQGSTSFAASSSSTLTQKINGTTTEVATPTFSPAGGTYTSGQSVTLSDATSGATIYYTTNGTTPTTSSTQYAGAITVSSSTMIQAIATASADSQSAVATATYTITPTAAPPTFSPVAGAYTSAQSVILSDTTPGATIYYTTNGTTPTASSTLYLGAISVAATTTIEAIAVASGYNNSSVSSATYTITPKAVAPTFTPAAGTYTTTQSVTLADTTSGAIIYYTTNGTTPTTASTKYTGAISVSATTTIEAIAVASGYANSTVASATYTITPPAATPTFSLAAGIYTTTQSVTLADTTTGATIYYTTNGTTPTTASNKYSGAISVSATTTIEAIAVATGYSNSAIASAKYTITPPAATPTFTPAAGTYTTTQSVTLADTTNGATIYYTTNGTAPTTASTKYTGAISVSATTTIEAIAVATGYTNSAVASAKYSITLPAATPTFSPAAGTYTTTQSVTLADTTAGAIIYYTTNGTTPTTSSTKYTGAISVASTTTIDAIAVATGYSTSSVASATYTITNSVATPVFSVAGGTYNSAQSVTITDATPGATIYYTTNGTTPTTASNKYTGTLNISASVTLEAIAVATGYTNSAAASATYTLVAATPTISPAGGAFSAPVTVTMATASPSAKIFYTTNGATPTASSTLYSAPITVSATETIKAIAAQTGFTQSGVASETFTFGAAATPTFSPAAGTYTATQSVTLADTTTGATIYYTTNGTAPTTASTKYTGAISVSATTTIKAIAAATGYANSAVASAIYTITLPAAMPTFSPAPGTYANTQSVTLADTTAGAIIYYTTNGTTPTTSSTKYTGAINVSATTTIEAIAVATGYSNSAVASATYTIAKTVATPVISVAGGTYNSNQSVTISDATPGATIYYTTNGTTPTTASNRYTGTLTIGASITLQAIAVATGYTNSAVATATYTFVVATPAITPAGGSFTAPVTVTITTATPTAKIFYTTNGATPSASSTLYSGPITVSATETIKAIAAQTGYAASAVAAQTYTITP